MPKSRLNKPKRKVTPTPAPGPWRICLVDAPSRLWRQGTRGRAGWWTSEPAVATSYGSHVEACKAIVAMLEKEALYASLAVAVEVK